MISNDITVVGSIALDSLETPKGNRDALLGGSAMYFSLSASLFSKVELIGIVGTDFPDNGWETLKSRNIDYTNIEIKDGKTFQWGGKYSDDYDSRETLFTELGVFDNYSPIINDTLHDSQFIFLGNIHPDMQMDVIKKSNDDQKIILDTMNLWINISLDRLKQVIAKTNIFLLNDEEAFLLTKKNKIESAAIALSELGPETIIIKKGSLGSYIYSKTNNFECNIPAFPIQKVIDTTGAGDSFAGGFVGSLNKNNIVDSVVAGSAIASFTVSEFGVDGLVNIKKEQIDERIEHIKYLMKD